MSARQLASYRWLAVRIEMGRPERQTQEKEERLGVSFRTCSSASLLAIYPVPAERKKKTCFLRRKDQKEKRRKEVERKKERSVSYDYFCRPREPKEDLHLPEGRERRKEEESKERGSGEFFPLSSDEGDTRSVWELVCTATRRGRQTKRRRRPLFDLLRPVWDWFFLLLEEQRRPNLCYTDESLEKEPSPRRGVESRVSPRLG